MQKFNPDIHHRKSIRLQHYDYSQEGLYFITICCKDRLCLLGNIVDGKMILSDLGKMAFQSWQNITHYYPQTKLHNFVIMPNHLHGIIEITHRRGESHSPQKSHSPESHSPESHSSPKSHSPESHLSQSTTNRPNGTSQTIGAMVRGFKSSVTSWARKNTDIFSVWQRNYYEHIIRNENAYLQIDEYIENNPLLWQQDRFYNNP